MSKQYLTRSETYAIMLLVKHGILRLELTNAKP